MGSRAARAKRKPERRKKEKDLLDFPAIAMWADREDMKDVHAWLRKIRTPRYLRDGGTLSSPPLEESKRKSKS